MYGALLGDIIGSPYEFDSHNIKTKDFPLFSKSSMFTDDSVMSLAVAAALMDTADTDDELVIKQALVTSMQLYGNLYPYAGYGGMFRHWLKEKNPKPYGSFGNGSAMRVSSVAWIFRDDFKEMRRRARFTAEVTHNHPEGIKGADAIACAIWMAGHHYSKEEIKRFLEEEFHYDLSRTCDEIRPHYHHVETCQETVPEAITAFLESNGFVDAIRTAVSLGGDSDTLTCITGGIADAYYGVPTEMMATCEYMLPEPLKKVLRKFKTEYYYVA